MMMRLTALFLLTHGIGSSSTIVVLLTRDKVYLASDSKRVDSYGGVSQDSKTCKAIVAGRPECCVAAAQGYVYSVWTDLLTLEQRTWNVQRGLRSAIEQGKSLSEVTEKAIPRLTADLKPALGHYAGPEGKPPDGSTYYFATVIAGFDTNEKVPRAEATTYWARPDWSIDPRTQKLVGAETPPGHVCLGVCAAVESYWNSHKDWYLGGQDFGALADP